MSLDVVYAVLRAGDPLLRLLKRGMQKATEGLIPHFGTVRSQDIIPYGGRLYRFPVVTGTGHFFIFIGNFLATRTVAEDVCPSPPSTSLRGGLFGAKAA